MARTLSEIYSQAKEYRDQYLELTEFENDSQMSILDAFTWVVAACIFAFENVLEIFKVDIARDLVNRINGTPAYYANALLKYQSGDELIMNDEGTSFSYASVDESKRVITRVSYSEIQEEGFYDKMLVLKVASGSPGQYERLTAEELTKVQAYIRQISFAGTQVKVISRKGDILLPKVTVYHDGAVSDNEVYSNIENALNNFVQSISFDQVVYATKVIDAIQSAEHVVDVYYDPSHSDDQGIFIAQYDDDDNLIPVRIDENGDVISYEQFVSRLIIPNSGYIRESAKTGTESNLPKWRECITLSVESHEI